MTSFSRLHGLRGRRLAGICAVALSLALSCGGTTQTPDDDGSGGSDGTGTGGAQTGSGAAAGTGATSAGGQGAGGGGSPGTGGDDASGGGGDGGLGGGSSGSGGTASTEHLVGLGDDCSAPGTFACSSNNELLALICGGEGEWEARETCDSGERCDFTDSADPGLCRVVLPDCETGSTEPFCGDTGLEVCEPGGFETEVLEACGPGESCTQSGCILVAEPCPAEPAVGCDYDCDLDDSDCSTNSACSAYFTFVRLDASSPEQVLRLGSDVSCTDEAFSGCPAGINFTAAVLAYHFVPGQATNENDWVRVTMAPGWEMYSRHYAAATADNGACFSSEGQCLILPPGVPQDPLVLVSREVVFYPQTDPPLPRNVTFEIVPEGTTCD